MAMDAEDPKIQITSTNGSVVFTGVTTTNSSTTSGTWENDISSGGYGTTTGGDYTSYPKTISSPGSIDPSKVPFFPPSSTAAELEELDALVKLVKMKEMLSETKKVYPLFKSNEYAKKYKNLEEFLKHSSTEEREQFLKDVIKALSLLDLLASEKMSSNGIHTGGNILDLLVSINGHADEERDKISAAGGVEKCPNLLDEKSPEHKIEIAEEENKIRFK